MKKKNRIAVIGGGVSGMTAAVTAAEQGADVLLLEQKEMTGKKILVTGNGRCNYTNRVQTPQCYRSDDPEFPWKVMQKFPAEKILELFQEMEFIQRTETVIFIPIQIRLLLWQRLCRKNWRGPVWRCIPVSAAWRSAEKKMDLRSVRREKVFRQTG